MDPEQTFIRVQERFSHVLTPRIRASLEYVYIFIAVTLFSVLVVMHANYVQQPGCSSQLTEVATTEAQLIQIKITSAGFWSQNEFQYQTKSIPHKTEFENIEILDNNMDESTFLSARFWFNWVVSSARSGKSALKFWKSDNELLEPHREFSTRTETVELVPEEFVRKNKNDESWSRFPMSAKESFKAAIVRIGKRWHGRLSFLWRHAAPILGNLWDIAGMHLNLDIPKYLHILHLDKFNSFAVQWLEKRSNVFEPTYLYTMEKGYFLLPEGAKAQHNIRTINISISARDSCFGNRWQQLLINRLVGYDTILMNSLLNSPGQGYLYNYQTKEFYNLTYAHEQPEGSARFGDYFATKCGVLMMSLFVFFTTTMSVSFTLRETQTRMLKFTVQLQHHARHWLPTFQLIFVHVPALQRFMQNRRSHFQQHPDFHITSSTILASTLHITRLNPTRNFTSPVNTTDWTPGFGPRTGQTDLGSIQTNGLSEFTEAQTRSENDNLNRVANPLQNAQQSENGANPGAMNSFSSLLLWILGGASSEGLNSFFSMFRDVRDQAQVYTESPQQENRATQTGH